MMALEDLQFSFRGLTFGAGTAYPLRRMEGFEGFESRTSDSDQPRGDGAIRGLDYVAPRTIAFEFLVSSGNGDYESIWNDIRETFRPSRDTDFDLTFKLPNTVERSIRCRPIQLIREEEYHRYGAVGAPPVVLRAVDPRIYSSTEETSNVPIYAASSGGLDFPIAEFPADYTGGTQSELVVNNDGTANAYPLIRVFGPVTGTCTGFTLTNTATDKLIEVSATIASGQILTADMETAVTGGSGLVISLGGSSRYGDWELPREPFYLAPGSNTLRFQVDGTSTDVRCVISWRDTWLD